MKCLKFIILVLFGTTNILQAQEKSDFMLKDSASQHHVVLSTQDEILITWLNTNTLKVNYSEFDLSLNEKGPQSDFMATQYPTAPRICFGDNGGIITWWSQNITPIGSWHVYGQFLSSGNDTIGTYFMVDDADYPVPNRRQQDVALVQDSSYVVVWSGNGPEVGDQKGVYGRLIDSPSGPVGANILLDDDLGPALEVKPKVTSLPTFGQFLVVWFAWPITGRPGLWGRVFTQTGVPVTSSQLLTSDTTFQDVFFLAAKSSVVGSYYVTWSEREDTLWRIKLGCFDRELNPLAESVQVNANSSTIEPYPYVDLAVDSSGRIVVAWEQIEAGRVRIFAQRYASDLSPIGLNFRLSTLPDSADHYYPGVLLLNNYILSFWQSLSAQGSQLWANTFNFDNPPTFANPKTEYLQESQRRIISFPNPFNSETKIDYTSQSSNTIQMRIFDILGRVVVGKSFKGPMLSYRWDGKDASGQEQPSGVYFATCSQDNKVTTVRLVLVR